MEFIKVGNIVNTFGIKGELKVKSCTDFPEVRFKNGSVLYILLNNNYDAVVAKGYRQHKGFILLSLKDLDNINYVEKYKDCDIFISKDDVHSLKKGQYYFFELNGCDVYYGDECIGKVTDMDGEYQKVLKIENENKEIFIPYVDRFIKNVNIDAKRIDVDVIEGML